MGPIANNFTLPVTGMLTGAADGLNATFRDGTVLINAVFAMSGIECDNAYILLPHKGGVSNHQCFILDFASSSVISTKFPNIVRCSARKLHCKST
jgi:hypothetical protein